MALIWPTYVVEAHPGHRDPAGDGGRDDDVAAAGLQVWQGEVGRVHRAPEVEILRTRWRKNMIAILCLSRICVHVSSDAYDHVVEGGYVGDLLEEAAGPHACVCHQVIHCRNDRGVTYTV